MITALISIYNPKKNVINNVHNIAQQVDRVILCDNSNNSDESILNEISNTNVQYVAFNENLGLSRAFNRILKDEQYEWNDDDKIIFFDQDSNIEANHIKNLVCKFDELKNKNYTIGCLGPIFYNTSNNKIEVPKLKKHVIENVYKVNNIITSSMLTQYEILRKVNFLNENIFLDFVDWDLCWRMQEQNYCCCMTEQVILRHSVGSGEKKIGMISLRVGEAFRVYYQTRDALYLLKENYIPIKMRTKLILTVTVRPIIYLFFLGEKKLRLFYFKRGIKDFVRGLRGEIGKDMKR